MRFQILRITDGTTTVNLLAARTGFLCTNWRPGVTASEGVWRESPLSDGRQLITRKKPNITERFTLQVRAFNPDDLIAETRKLRALLEKAESFWLADWQNEPVWIEAQGDGESQLRYGLIVTYQTPEDQFPYAPPFWGQVCAASMEDFELLIERYPYWLAHAPGAAECLEIAGQQEWAWPWYLEFDGADSVIDCGNDAALQDLHAGPFTVEAWIRANSYGEGNTGFIACKGNGSNTGWLLRVGVPVAGLNAWVTAATNAISAAGEDDFNPATDHDWHHVAMTYSQITRVVRLFIDGVEVSYALQQVGAGAIVSDVASNFYIGNRFGLDATWDGDIGWLRVSNAILYVADFTPPERCALPEILPTTVTAWIHEGTGLVIDNMEGTAARDGTAADCTWADDCAALFGQAATCEHDVYFANAWHAAQLTHIFHYDASAAVFSANLLTLALPYNLLPAVPAVGDYVIFMIAAPNGGPFWSLVFDLIAQNDIADLTWEYYSTAAGPAWTALLVANGLVDQTDWFDNNDVNSVAWPHQQGLVWPGNDWQTVVVNGVTGWAVRARVTNVGGAPTAPIQQNRHPYTVAWPYVDIADTDIIGDLAALIRQYCEVVSNNEVLQTLVATRSLSRGTRFNAYLNLGSAQMPTGVTITYGANTAATNLSGSPTGSVAVFTPVGVAALADRVTVSLDATLTQQYGGRYQMFVRCYQYGGAADTIEAQVEFEYDTNDYRFYTTSTLLVDSVDLLRVLDFGVITIPVIKDAISIIIRLSSTAANALYLYDLVLMPVDEIALWLLAADETDGYELDPPPSPKYEGLVVDSLSETALKRQIEAAVYAVATTRRQENWQPLAQTPYAWGQAGADGLRVWFFSHALDGDILSCDDLSAITLLHRTSAEQNARYLSMRGAT